MLPPSETEPSVLSERELALVSHVKSGKEYVATGRFDLAEFEFRKALDLAPGRASLYNDLGFILSGQQRYQEAIDLLRIAQRFAPTDVSTRFNMAVAFYRNGDLEHALKAYEDLLTLHFASQLTEVGRPQRLQLTPTELAEVYSNIALIYYSLGPIDEAVCHSSLSTAIEPSIERIAQHVRLLMSLERTPEATALLRSTILEKRDQVPPALMLDFGSLLYVTGDLDTAAQALNRVSTIASSDSADRIDARVLELLVARKQERELEELWAALDEDAPRLCDMNIVGRHRYWPELLAQEVESLLGTHCNEQVHTFF